MQIVIIAINELYGEYVFSEFSEQETFYTYVEELKKEMKEEDDLNSLCFVKGIKTLGKDKNIIFVEKGWDKIPDLVK